MQELQRSGMSRSMQNYDGCILWIEFTKMVENGIVVEPEGIIGPSDGVVVGTSQRE